MLLQENILFDPRSHEFLLSSIVIFRPAKFAVAMSNGLGGDAFTSNITAIITYARTHISTHAHTHARTDGRRNDFGTKLLYLLLLD